MPVAPILTEETTKMHELTNSSDISHQVQHIWRTELMDFFGNTQHGNTKEMKGIGAFAHTGLCLVASTKWRWECRRGNCQVTKENLDGLNQNHSFVLLSETFGCWWARMNDQDVSGLSDQMSTFICEGWVWVKILNLNMLRNSICLFRCSWPKVDTTCIFSTKV